MVPLLLVLSCEVLGLLLREGVLSKTSGSGRDLRGEASSEGMAARWRLVATIIFIRCLAGQLCCYALLCRRGGTEEL